jgi:hypothetical protein
VVGTIETYQQLVEYIMEWIQIGYPNEHLAGTLRKFSSPLYATAVGLVMKALKINVRSE